MEWYLRMLTTSSANIDKRTKQIHSPFVCPPIHTIRVVNTRTHCSSVSFQTGIQFHQQRLLQM